MHVGGPTPGLIPWVKEHKPDGIIYYAGEDTTGVKKITAPKVSIGQDVGTEGWIGVDNYAIGAAVAALALMLSSLVGCPLLLPVTVTISPGSPRC